MLYSEDCKVAAVILTLCHFNYVFRAHILTSKYCVNSPVRFLKFLSANSNLISQSFLLISDSDNCCLNKVCQKWKQTSEHSLKT